MSGRWLMGCVVCGGLGVLLGFSLASESLRRQLVSEGAREALKAAKVTTGFAPGSFDPLLGHDARWTWNPGSRLASEEVAIRGQNSPGCTKSPGWPKVEVPLAQYHAAFGGGPGQTPEFAIEVDPREVCFTPGYGIWVIARAENGKVVYAPDAIWSRINRIEVLESGVRVKLITQVVGTPIYHWPSRARPPFHPGARVLHRASLLTELPKIELVIDTRSREAQEAWPLRAPLGARVELATESQLRRETLHWPYHASAESLADAKADSSELRRAKHEELGDEWESQIWQAWDREKAILLIGQNPSDSRVIRAIAWLHEAGFKNLFWFYEGADAFHWPQNEVQLMGLPGPNLFAPLPKVQEMVLAKSATLVDLRSQQEYQRLRHPLALHIPYEENRRDEWGLIRGWMAMDVFQILRSGDRWDLDRVPKDRDIILFATDRYDWRAVKAFWRLRHRRPEQRLGLVKDGMAEFGLWSRMQPGKIQLEGSHVHEIQ
ncbi:MAG TPA: rhodanese-like domain-containing protein [Pseudobdellovibrionaceae bacterium]|nr:rhodanese-like domain-containing protein [Pseudobdellovibrionaceae bacterium]